jgi:hypothetical protein
LWLAVVAGVDGEEQPQLVVVAAGGDVIVVHDEGDETPSSPERQKIPTR